MATQKHLLAVFNENLAQAYLYKTMYKLGDSFYYSTYQYYLGRCSGLAVAMHAKHYKAVKQLINY